MKNTIIAIVLVVLAGAGGYFVGAEVNMDAHEEEELQDSITMMKEQSATINKMGEMMKTGGVMMQDLGIKYKDEGLVIGGKDMVAVGEKYIKDNESHATKSASMKQMME